jgi:hypothetical protein
LDGKSHPAKKKRKEAHSDKEIKELKALNVALDDLRKKASKITPRHLVTSGRALRNGTDRRMADAIATLEQIREWAK